MKEYCFPYREEVSRVFGHIGRPVVEAHLKAADGNWFKVFPYADSGADFSLFPRSVAKILSLKLKTGQRSFIQGVGGRRLVIYIHRVELRIGDKKLSVRAGFAFSDRVPYLLGRIDMLEHFDIRFELHRVCFVERSA
jgi:hypothetical protein